MANEILCPYCKRLIKLPSIEYGSREKCPHCELDFVVSHRLIPQEKAVSVGDEGGDYALQTKIPGRATGEDLLSDANVAEEVGADVEEAPPTWRPLQAPPLELFLKGTFTYPFSAGSRGWFLILLVLSLAVEGSAWLALYYLSFPASNLFVAFAWFASALLNFFTIMLALVFLFTLSAIGLAILQDTSEGLEKLVNRPQGIIIGWIGDVCYILINLFYGALPALILFLVLPDSPRIKMPIAILSETIFFPVFLLSSLVSDSIVMPYSKPVWQSLRNAWHAWVLFYLFTLLVGESFVLFSQWIPYRSIWIDALVISILPPFFWIVYFRLLGRLALYCSGLYDELHPLKKFQVPSPES